MSKMAACEKSQDINTLEQYTHKNRLRLFGIRELGGDDSPEQQAIQVIKENLHIDLKEDDIEIAEWAGKFWQEGL